MAQDTSRELTDAKRFLKFCGLKAAYDGIKLRHGVIGDFADKYNVTPKTVKKYWRLGNGVATPEDAWDNLNSKRKAIVAVPNSINRS